jgi:chitodextrinase
MAKFVFSNFAVSTLSVAISDTDSALQMNVDDVAKFPSLTGGAKFPLVLADSDDNVEIVYVSALSPSGAATIERGAEGTIAQSWLAGTLLRHTFTAATIIGAAGFNPRGPWLATSSYSPGDVVTNLNISYLAVTQNINSVPSLSNPNWQVIYQPPGTSSTALNAVGRWNSSTTYAAGSVVEFNGIEWYSNANGNLNHAPAYGSTFWTHFSPWSGAAKFVAVLAFAGDQQLYSHHCGDRGTNLAL